MTTYVRFTVGLLIIATLAGSMGCTRQQKKQRSLANGAAFYAAGQLDKAAIEYLKVLRLDHTDANAFYQVGRIYFEQNRLRESAPFILRAKELAPKDPQIRLQVAKLYLSGQAPARARPEILAVLDLQPTNSEAILLFVDASIGGNDVQDAKLRLRQLRQKFGNRAAFDLAFGALAWRQREVNNALDYFQKAAALDPKFAPAHLALGKILWFKNEKEPADKELKLAAELSPARSLSRLTYVDFKIKTGAIEEAKKLLREILQQAPDYVPATLKLAELAFQRGDYAECQSYCEKALARQSLSVEAGLLLSRAYLELRKPSLAVKELEKLLQWSPQDPFLHYQLGLTHWKNGDVEKASTSLKQALVYNPNLYEASLLLAEVDFSRGEATAVIPAMSELLKKLPTNAPLSLVYEAQYHLADGYRIQGLWNQALPLYRRLAEMAPKDPRPWFSAGICLVEMKRTADARTVLQQAANLSPENVDVMKLLAQVDIEEKKDTDAINRLRKGIEIQPKAVSMRFLLARIHVRQQQYEEAATELRKIVDISPENSTAFAELAQLYRFMNKTKDAVDVLESLLAKKPQDAAILVQLASTYQAVTNRAKAIDTLEKVAALDYRIDPARKFWASEALNNLACLYAQEPAQLARASDCARRARDLAPNNPAIADTLGWICLKQGDYPRALALLRDAANSITNRAEVQSHLGLAYYMHGEEAAATKAFQSALQLSSAFDDRDQAAEYLRLLSLNAAGGNPKIQSELEAHMAKTPADPVASVLLATIYESKAQPEKALRLCEQTLKANTNSALLMAKVAQLSASDPAKKPIALEWAQKARKLAPNNSRVMQISGQVAFATGDYSGAATLLADEVRRHPQDADLAFQLGLAYLYTGRLAEADRTWRELRQNNPSSNRAEAIQRYQTLAGVLSNPAAASTQSRLAADILQTSPNDPLAQLVTGLIQEQQGQTNNAQQTYEKILGRYPAFSPVYPRLAFLYLKAGSKLSQAGDLAAKARQAYPQDPETAKLMGIAALNRNENSRAVQWLQDSQRQLTNDAELHYYLGKAHFLLNNKAASKTALDRGLVLGLDAQRTAEAKSMLSKLK